MSEMKREVRAYVDAEGLAAKLAVIQAHADLLLTDEVIAEVAGVDAMTCPLPNRQQRCCRWSPRERQTASIRL